MASLLTRSPSVLHPNQMEFTLKQDIICVISVIVLLYKTMVARNIFLTYSFKRSCEWDKFFWKVPMHPNAATFYKLIYGHVNCNGQYLVYNQFA